MSGPTYKKDIDEIEKRYIKQLMMLDKVIAMVPGHIYWSDNQGVMLGCNEQQAKDLDLPSRESIVGKTLFDLQPQNLAVTLHKNNLQVMNAGDEITFEEQAKFNGRLVTCLSHKAPVRDNEGHVIGLVGVSIDITDRKIAEEYKLKHEAAQKVINFSNLMVGSIARELRTPLAGIRVNMENLRDMDFDKMSPQVRNKILRKTAEFIIKTIDKTRHIIDDILLKVRAFSVGEVKHGVFEEISIAADIENILETYPFESGQQKLIKVFYGARFKYLGDKALTAHVLGNLLKNALCAIQQSDKVDVDITIETKTRGDANLLIFRDTATGIPKDFIGKIFDQFETKHGIRGGTGLGLAFCKMVVEDCYGGSITCDSKEGKYTEFVLSFPKIKTII